MKKFAYSSALAIIFFGLSGCSTIKSDNNEMANCELNQPPTLAGEDGAHGTLLKVFPRKLVIDNSYSGCQIVWAREGSGWSMVMIGVFERGLIIKMRFPSKPGDPVEQCLKEAGVLQKGDKDVCSALDAFPYSSASPGCLSGAKDEANVGACTYD